LTGRKGISQQLVNVNVSLINLVDVRLKLRATSTRTYLTDFLVLSDDILALFQSTENAIELCQLSARPTPSLQTIGLLELPPLLPYARLATATVKTETNPAPGAFATQAYYAYRRSRPPPRHPFGPSAADALVLLTLSAKITGSVFVDTRTYTLAVHARTLLSYASSSSSSKSSSHDPSVAVPWDAWGPPATRCFDEDCGSSFSAAAAAVMAVAGQRWFDRGIIRDFCPRRIRAAGSPATAEKSTLAAGSVFARGVESALPYSETSLAKYDDDRVPGEDAAALIDGERIMFFVAGNKVCEAHLWIWSGLTMTQSVNLFFFCQPGRDELIIHVHPVG